MAVVVSWNVAGRVRSLPRQAAALAERPADVVALQEVRISTLSAWRERLASIGLVHALSSLDPSVPWHGPERRLGVLVAARAPLEAALPLELPRPERHVAVWTEIDGAVAELHNLHAPLSNAPDNAKVRTLEALHQHLAIPSLAPRILVGDINTPRYESREGEVLSFARTRAGRLRCGEDARHDAAEMSIVTGLSEHGYVDAFRELHGYERRDRSWAYPGGSAGYRLDHVFVRGLRVIACDYVHEWRRERLSDHSAIWAELAAPA